MKPLIVLLITFICSLLILRLIHSAWDFTSSGNIAMGCMLLFTAIGHFKFPEGMAMMIPEFIPFKKELIYVTGILEIILGIGLLFSSTRFIAGLVSIIFFIVILPANIHAAIHKIDHEKATFDGKGKGYLWFRIPLQLFFIAWLLFFSISR